MKSCGLVLVTLMLCSCGERPYQSDCDLVQSVDTCLKQANCVIEREELSAANYWRGKCNAPRRSE